MAREYSLITPAASQLVSAADLKAFARIEGSDLDALINANLVAAQQYVRDETRRALLTETWALWLDDWPLASKNDWWDGVREAPIAVLAGDSVVLERAPFAAISKVETLDEAGTATEWASTNYYTVTEAGFGRLVAKKGSTLPTPGRDRHGIKITFTVGTNSAGVPSDLVLAVKMLATTWTDDPECAANGEAPHSVTRLIAKHRTVRI